MRAMWPWLVLSACKPAGGFDLTGDLVKDGDVCEASFELAHAAPGAVVAVDLDETPGSFEEDVLRMRAVEIDTAMGATLTVSGPVQVLDSQGVTLASGAALASGPQTLYLQGIGPGPARLDLEPEQCAAASAGWDLTVRPPPQLAGHAMAEIPYFDFVDQFNTNESVQLALDDHHFPDRVGLAFDAYVVAHRDAAEWADDPTLVDLADGPVSGTLVAGGRDVNTLDLWLSDLVVDAGLLTADYDVVLDFGGDGQLDPGDVIDGLDAPGFTAIRDLTEPGPYAIDRFEHSAGYWQTMVVYVPSEAISDPVPLVVISHGNGHEYTWYDYLGEHLASWGYAVISHRNDTMPGPVTAASTTLQNTEVFLRDAPGMGLSVTVDAGRIGWIGHSRGGEGVAIAYDDLVNGNVGVSEFDAADIRLVQSIAPTIFEGPGGANPNDVSFHILAGACDGDVTGGVDLPDVQYLRMYQYGTGDHWLTYVHGADHNDFNCCGPNDSGWWTVSGNPPTIGRERAQAVAQSYLLALLEYELRGNDALAGYFYRLPELFRPIGAEAVIATVAMPGVDREKWVLDDFQGELDSDRSSSGGTVSWTVDNFAEGPLDDPDTSMTWSASQPSNGMTWSSGDAYPERGLVVDWVDGQDVSVTWEVVAGERDWTGWKRLSLRAAQMSRHPATQALDEMLSFSLTLVDGAGVESAVDFAVYGRIPSPYPRAGNGTGVGWVNEFQTVTIDLAEFGADTPLDRSDIVALRFDFGAAHGSAQGGVGLDDLELLGGMR